MPPRKPKEGQSLADLRPDLVEEWDWDKNDLNPKSISQYSHVKVWWWCSLHGSYQAMVSNRSRGNGCCHCGVSRRSSQRSSPPTGMSLLDKNPNIASEWDNHLNDKSPSDVYPNSNKKYAWKCYSKGHVWWAPPQSRVSGGSNCPVCSGYIPEQGVNDLKTLYPNICKYWSVGNTSSSEEFLPSSNKIVSWICDYGHEYKRSVVKQVACMAICPYCTGRRVLSGFNDLLSTHPDLVAQWSSDNTINYLEVSAGSKKTVNWVCSSGHGWSTTVHSRAKNGHGCPECVDNLGSETILREYLHEIYGPTEDRKIDDCRWISGRIMVVDYVKAKLVVEYDGGWHKKEKSLLNDAFKTQELLDKGYRVVRLRQNGVQLLSAGIPVINEFDIEGTYWDFEDHPNLLQVPVKWDKEGKDIKRVIDEVVVPWVDSKDIVVV